MYTIDRLPASGLLLVRGPKPEKLLLNKAGDAGLFWDAGHRALVGRETSATKRAAARLLEQLSSTQSTATLPELPRPTLAPAPRATKPTTRQPAPSRAPEITESDGGTRRIPVASIRTDESRFQNRESAFSQASVDRIVKNFDARKLDPIVVWRDDAGKVYVLSGHSRLEAHRQLELPTIPVRFFDGTEAEAIQFARVEANRGATAESLTEDIRAFRAQRDGADGIPKLTKQALRDQWGAEAGKLDAYTYLSDRGKFIRNLALPKNQREQFPFLEQAAQWVGELRKGYPALTNEHENELFDFLQNNRRGVGLTRDEFFRRVEKKVNSLTFDPDRALGMTVATTEEEARADTGPAERRRQQVELELERLGELFRAARTPGEKAQLRREIDELQTERDRLRRDISLVLRTQQGLFGKRRKAIGAEADAPIVSHKNQRLAIVDLPTLEEYQQKYPALAAHDNGWVRGVAQGKNGAYYGFFFNWATGEVQQVKATPFIR